MTFGRIGAAFSCGGLSSVGSFSANPIVTHYFISLGRLTLIRVSVRNDKRNRGFFPRYFYGLSVRRHLTLRVP